MGVAVCSGGTVKWSGAGDGSRWSDLANWVDGGTVDFAKAHVYDLSAAEDGANLVNDKVSSIGGFVLGAGQGTVTLSSTVAASALHGTWMIPASTTFVLKQVYRGMWSDYGTTTVSGGGTLRLDAADFQSANRAWNIEGGTVVELAHGFPVDPSDPGGVGCGGIVVGAPKQSDARFCMAMVEGRSEIMNVSGFGYVGLGGSQTGTWCHLALVQAADGSRKFYVNKALKDTKAAGTESDLVSQPLVLGDFVEGSWGASFDGDMDEVLVFDRELSADEIEGLYDNPLQATADVRVPEPVVHWAFDEAATPGRDAKAVLDLEARGPVDIASTDHTWGSAYRSLSDAAGFLSYAGAFPAAFPVGRHSFSVSIRMAVGGGTEGVAPFAFGDLSRANAFFRIGVNAHPSRVGVTVTQAGVANKFDTYASGADHAHALEEASSLSHYVFTYDADHRLLVGYRDGVKTVSKTDVDVELPASGSVFVGYRPDALDTRRFQGLVDDVQVFDGALSEEEVLLLTRKLHFGDGVRAGRATAPDSPVCVEEGATLRFEGPGHTVGSLSGAGRVELANGASVVLSAVDAFTGTFSGEGALALADGCVLSVDAKRPDLPVADISRVTALPSHAVVRIADDKEGLLKTLARARVFTVLRANGFEDVEALSTWTVPFAAPGSYRFEVEDGCVLLKFRLGFCIIVK